LSALSDVVLPSNLAYLIFIAGLVARLRPRTREWSQPLLASAAVFTLIFSSGWIAALLLEPLEYRYPSWTAAQHPQPPDKIVVLTGWAADEQGMPLSGRLNSSSAYRVLMAAEIFRSYPASTVIVSGDVRTTEAMGAVLQQLGVPQQQLMLEQQSPSTAASAANLASLLRNQRFILVTSAGHMPRSMAVFRKQGSDPIPAPTEHRFTQTLTLQGALPRPSSLYSSDLAVHEYLGYLWYKLRGEL